MTAEARITLPDWPRLMNAPLAARYLGIGETTLRELGLRPRSIGRRVLYDRNDLDRYADALSGQPLDEEKRQAEGDDIARRIQERLSGKR